MFEQVHGTNYKPPQEAAARGFEALLWERRVKIVLAEVVPAEVSTELLECELEAVVNLMIVPLDFTRVVVGVAYMDSSAWHDQQLLGISPQALRPPLDIAVERLALLDAGRVGEHDIG